MHATLSLMRREFGAYFLSPIGYVVFTVFLVVTGHLFYLTMVQLTATGSRGVYFPMQPMVSDNWFWLVFLFIPPLLTMRLFAEERGSGTLEMLLTAPCATGRSSCANLRRASRFMFCCGCRRSSICRCSWTGTGGPRRRASIPGRW